MKRFVSLFSVLLLAGALASPVFAFEGMDTEFSADMVNEAGGRRVEGKIFVSHGRIRTEMMETVMIMRMDRNISYMVMPSERMYMEQPLNPEMFGRISKEVPGETERVLIGPDVVDGKPCQKFKVTFTQDGRSESMYQWTGDQPMPLKMAAMDGSWWLEYRNLRTGPQSESLFEPPTDYQKMGMPSMPGDISSMIAAAQQQAVEEGNE